MKKKIFALLMSLCLIIPACVYADDATTENKFLTNIVLGSPPGQRIGVVELEENQSSVTIDFSKVSNPCSNYYIGLYYIIGELDGETEESGYIIKNVGPITTDKFTFTGLKSGIKYRIHLSSTINREDVDGAFIVR